jgi:hypothetical protein
MYMVVTMPRVGLLVALALVGVMLIRTYDWQWVVVMRYVLIMDAAVGLISVVADTRYFPNRVGADAVTVVFPIAYTIYFYISARVRSVFVDRMWNGRAVSVA